MRKRTCAALDGVGPIPARQLEPAMKTHPVLSLLLVLFAASAFPADATGHGGPQPTPENRLVGLWDTQIYVGPDGCRPGAPRPPGIGHNTLIFNVGGTLVENPGGLPLPLPGVDQQRTFGLGKWSYDRRTGRFAVIVRFDWYASSDGAYLGYQIIDRTILLSNDGRTAFGPVVASRYLPDGTFVGKLCGEAVSHRL